MSVNLTDQDCAELARILRGVIEADTYPFSPKVRRWKELLAKIDPVPEPVVTPHPCAEDSGCAQPTAVTDKRQAAALRRGP